jgi:cation diffusion facilitator CzcD-associated flavoprotein CzcO
MSPFDLKKVAHPAENRLKIKHNHSQGDLMTAAENFPPQRSPKVVVIGAGMTGVLMTIKLREAGITDVTILEKKDRLGGTWRENTYPGLACDIPAHMYTYSFEPNPNWSHRFAHGPEIQKYFEHVGRKYGVTDRISFNEAVTSSIYNDGKWTVTTSKGNTYIADFVINSTGILHHPAKPNIKGIESFEGKMFHTAEWDHSISLKGKRVGIIGTGSTAAQAIPEVAKEAGHFSIFQRTAQWIFPLGNKKFSEDFKQKLRDNPNRLRRLRSAYTWGLQHFMTKAVTGHQPQRALFSAACQLNLRFSIKDKALRKKLTPDYAVGCKRIIINKTFYDAVQRDNVELVTDGISEITPKGIRTADGKEHELDVLILSTGFKPFNFMRPMDMRGKNGLHIDDAWAKKIQTYRSLFIPEFPNSFLMLGPNTPIGNYSVIAMSEVQCAYILKVIKRWQQGEFDAIEPKPEAVKAFNEYVKAGMANTVWVGGCKSWYLDDDGDPVLWPYTWEQWEKEMAEPEMGDFITEKFPAKVTASSAA